jgi:C_GCAxxG_C_C family probable redox protein
MTGPVQLAADRFAQGFNCAQSVLSAFAAQSGLSEETALRMAAPFGGGIARQGQVCGALTGALLVLGLRRGQVNPQNNDETYRIAQEFMQTFRERNGAILCRDLLGRDLSTPEGLPAARQENITARMCPALVRSAAGLLAEIENQ